MNTRALAARVITDVFVQGISLTDALGEYQNQLSNTRDQALLQELCFGVVRWWWRFDAMINQLIDKPLKAKDSDVKHLLMLGFYQLSEMRIPDHAAVAETVDACGDLNKPWAKKLVNAVLRNFQRKADSIATALADNTQFQYSHPQWLFDAFRKAWPNDWLQIIEANNQKPPMVLRVNLQKKQRVQYQQALTEVGLSSREFVFNTSGLVLDKPVSVEQLPGFNEGWVSVQDGAAQLAAGLLELDNVRRVLDVCAAPGGKAAHILESAPGIEKLMALDIDPARLSKVHETLKRLGLHATLLQGDAQHPEKWWDKQAFDRILLDAPCSATGVIRRHPDIKQLRRATDISQLVTLQAHILNAVWPLLGSGGMLLYVTCSILPEENELQIGKFVEQHSDVRVINIESDWGMQQHYGRQILPGQQGMDGFYYACLQKH